MRWTAEITYCYPNGDQTDARDDLEDTYETRQEAYEAAENYLKFAPGYSALEVDEITIYRCD